MCSAIQNLPADPDWEPLDSTRATQQNDAGPDAEAPIVPNGKPAPSLPGSFGQPEQPDPDTMPPEGGPHPEQTAGAQPGMRGQPAQPGARGHHNSAPANSRAGDKGRQ
ncbi:hypothetical protein ACLKMY_01610 [Paraburkholderia mimosarum]|uniref:hypothetical protein n=1 Tax=Paraburkholderia mimosarum TaxID=312026 RepID=UPI0039C39C88